MDLIVENLKKVFSGGVQEVQAVHGVSFSVPQGQFFTLLGPSGSGKTTILRCIGGLEMPDGGEIRLGNRIFYSDKKRIALMPEERGIGMVFQSYAIWPHLTVYNNVAFPLQYGLKRVPKAEIKSKVMRVLGLVQMDHLESRMATQLSGGQQQRVALARALVTEPDLLLLDEPLSNLDAKLRDEMRVEIRRIQTTIGITTMYVTHDQSEAITMSDQIALLKDGAVVQIGTPRELYERPRDFFASSFIGTSNTLPGTIQGAAKTGYLGMVRILGRDLTCLLGEGCRENSEVVVCIRPEDIEAKSAVAMSGGGWEGVVRQVTYSGDSLNCEIDLAGRILHTKLHPAIILREGEPVLLNFKPERAVAIPPETVL